MPMPKIWTFARFPMVVVMRDAQQSALDTAGPPCMLQGSSAAFTIPLALIGVALPLNEAIEPANGDPLLKIADHIASISLMRHPARR